MKMLRGFKQLTVLLLVMGVQACTGSDGNLSQPPEGPAFDLTAPTVTFSVKAVKAGKTILDANLPKDPYAADCILPTTKDLPKDPYAGCVKPGPKPELGSTSATISSGGSVMLSWKVVGANKVEINSRDGKRKLGEQKFEGSLQVDNITADTSFVLTALGGKTIQKTVDVKVTKREPVKFKKFTATPSTITVGESTLLCWASTDDSASVVVKNGDDVVYPQAPTEFETPATADVPAVTETPAVEPAKEPTTTVPTITVKAMLMLLDATSPAAKPTPGVETPADTSGTPLAEASDKKDDTTKTADVCQSVTPSQTTTYTATVTGSDHSTDTLTAVVTVQPAAQIQIAFAASVDKLPAPGEVRLMWSVVPADATVTIDGVLGAQPSSSTGTSVKIDKTTTFTLTATSKDGKTTAQKQITVMVGSVFGSAGKITLSVDTPYVFAGEKAVLSMIAEGVDVTAPVTLSANGATSTVVPVGGKITIDRPTADVSYSIEIAGTRSNGVSIQVRHLEMRDGSSAWSSVVLPNIQKIYAGATDGAVEEEGKTTKLNVRYADVSGGNEVVIKKQDIADGLVNMINKEFNRKQFSHFGPYSIHAMVADPSDASRIFAGTTGALLMSKDGGKSWTVVDPLLIFKTSSFTEQEQHPGCNGKIQKGIKYAKANGGLVGMSQICDIAVNGKSVTIATDQGTYTVTDIDARMANKKDAANFWKPGLKGKVVNKLELATVGEQSVLVAATSNGVYINSNNGAPADWQQLDAAGLSGQVNAVAISGNTVFAGSANGLFKYEGLTSGNGSWKLQSSVESGVAVKALTVDAKAKNVLFVGTDKGLRMSRDCGATAASIAADVGDVRAIDSIDDNGRSVIAVAASKGLFVSQGNSMVGGECSLVPASAPATTPPPAKPETPTTGGTVKPNR